MSDTSQHRRISRLGVVAFGLFLLCGAVAGGLAAFAGAAAGSATLTWTWSMPDRFGLDANQDGLIDYSSDRSYVSPDSWLVDVDACSSPAITTRDAATTKVTWTILSGPGLDRAKVTQGLCKTRLTTPKLGEYKIIAGLTDEKDVRSAAVPITLKDTFIVSIGDSVASGEGNPDKVTRKDTALPLYQATWQDYRCDRSALAGPAQAALRLEKRDPHSSITFVHLACSGATITDGVLGLYEGQNPPPGAAKIPSQLSQVITLTDLRPIDDLTVSIGANDMGFAKIVKDCLYEVACNADGANGVKDFNEGKPTLKPKYDELEKQINAVGRAKIANVVQTEYYDVSTNDASTTANPQYCTGDSAQEQAGDTAPGTANPIDGFSAPEYKWARETVGVALNGIVADHVAHANATYPDGPKWKLVDGIAEGFNGHGYCATDRYVRQMFESLSSQGAIDGAFHPNSEGHLRVYGAKIEKAIADNLGWTDADPQVQGFADDDRVSSATQGVSQFLGTLDRSGAFDKAADNLPFGARDGFKVLYNQLFQGISALQQGVQLSVPASTTWTAWQNKLNDIDGDGDPTNDVHLKGPDGKDIPGIEIDLQVDASPKLITDHYDVGITLKMTAAGNTKFAWVINALHLADADAGIQAGAAASFTVGTTMQIAPLNGMVKFKVGPVAAADLELTANFDSGKALSFQSGLLSASATGAVNADIGAALAWNPAQDVDKDGWIKLSELTSSPFTLGCTSTGVQGNLAVSASLTGLEGKLGSISIADPTLCDGLSSPQVQLADLGQFQNLTIGDVLNGIAQVARSLQTAQAAGDIDLPFLKQKLSAVTDVTGRLTKFFTDLGLTSADQPLANIDVGKAAAAGITSLQTLAGKLSCAVFAGGQDPCTDAQRSAIGLKYDSTTKRVTFTVSYASTPAPVAASVDLGTALGGTGVADISGTAAATIAPGVSVGFGFGFDLTPGTKLADRFFLTNGPGGRVIGLDARVSADLELKGSVALASIALSDGVANGSVPLLRPVDPTKPMVGVSLDDPNRDGVVTLTELTTPQGDKRLPFTVAFNAEVPPTTLSATLTVLDQPVAAGAVRIAWRNVPDTTGLQVSADGGFTTVALPFAYDPANPQALVGQVVGAVRSALTTVRGTIAKGGTATTTPLPLVGKSIAELDPVLSKLQTSMDALVATTDTFTLKSLQDTINQKLVSIMGLPTGSAPVTFSYDAVGTDGRPALVVKLALGACTADRAAKITDGTCTVTPQPLNLPISLSLGNSALGGVAGAQADGGVVAGFDARANLTFGVLLPRVTLGAAGGAPVVDPATKVPAFFLQDSTRFEVGVGAVISATLKASVGPVRAALGTADDPATAQLAAHLLIADPQAVAGSPKRYVVGTPGFTAFLSRLVPNLSGLNLQDTRPGLGTNCAPPTGTIAPQACAHLPVTVLDSAGNPAGYLGAITVTLPNLLDPSGWKVDTADVEAHLNDQALQFALIVNGVDSLAAELQHALENLPPGTKIPFLGSNLSGGADLVKGFRDSILGKLKDAADAMQKVSTVGAVRNAAAPILAGIGNLVPGTTPTITFYCGTTGPPTACTDDSTPVTAVRSVEFGVHMALAVDQAHVPFDIGFPGLSLTGGSDVHVSGGLTLDLAFGIDRQLGFYIPTDRNSMNLGVAVNLPNVENGPDFTGTIAFVPIEVEDSWRTNPANNGRPDASAGISVALTSTRPDKRVGLSDLSSLSITPTVHAEAHIDLAVKTVKPADAPSGIPSISTGIRSEVGVTWTPGTDPKTVATLAFNDVTLDAGSLVSDFITPVIHKVHEFTQPLEKPIAELQKPIPGTDLAGTPKTWLQLMKAVAGDGTAMQVVDRVIQLTDLVKTLDDPSAKPGRISIGSFQVAGDAVTAPVPASAAGSVISAAQATTDPLSQLQFAGADGGAQAAALKAQTTKGGLNIPILSKPTSLFSLLLGQDVPLVTFDAGTLSVSPSLQVSFPVGPAVVYVGGLFKVTGHFAAGFDTYGIRQALMHKDDGAGAVAMGLLQGFYLDDNDASGKDVPEISLRAELTVGASIGVPGLSFAIEGGIGGQFDFNLYTKPDWHGKVRIQNILDQIDENPNPLCFFDIGAKVDIVLRLKVDTSVGNATFDIADKTIWKQRNLSAACHGGDVTAGAPATMGKGGVVTLKGTDDFDDFVITLNKLDPVAQKQTVTIDNGDADPVTFAGVTKIVGDLEKGDDSLQLVRGDDALGGLPVVVCGGGGTDVLNAADLGPATFYGDGGPGCDDVPKGLAGDDRLTGSDSADKLDGGDGKDILVGNGGPDAVTGGAGDDTLQGGGGSDTLDGGAGDDVLVGGDGNDTITGGADADTVDYSDHKVAVNVTVPGTGGSTGESDTIDGDVENLTGGNGGDTLVVATGRPTVVSGGSGPDTVRTGSSTAVVFGGYGNDVVTDEPGAQTFWGGPDTDTFSYAAATSPVSVTVDGVADDGVAGAALDNVAETEIVNGGNGNDHLGAGSGPVTFRGNGGNDLLEGGAGTDALFGGPGNDTLRGGQGSNTYDGGVGDDVMVGGTDADVYDGGAGKDTVDYSERSDGVTVTLDNVRNDGRQAAWPNTEYDNVKDTVEVVHGTQGNDWLYGSHGANELYGEGGTDRLTGGPDGQLGVDGGADLLDGGDGQDRLCDVFQCNTYTFGDTSNDVLRGGADADQLYGNGGNDTFDGGDGNDYISGNDGVDTVNGGSGRDTIVTYGGGDTVDGGPDGDTVWAGRGNDTVVGGGNSGGTAGDETLIGGQGSDDITASPEGSSLRGGTGGVPLTGDPEDGMADVLKGGPGGDAIWGGTGNDLITTGDGTNSVKGMAGDDTITGGAGRDIVDGDSNYDTSPDCVVTGASCNDTINGMGGDDGLGGGYGNDVVEGGDGNDGVAGGAGADQLSGGAGDDNLDGGTGSDVLDGGTGADIVAGYSSPLVHTPPAGDVDTVTYAGRTGDLCLDETYVCPAAGRQFYGDPTLDAPQSPAGAVYGDRIDPYTVQRVVGGSGRDTIVLATRRDRAVSVDGGPGNDTITVLQSVGQNATLLGGDGNDTFVEPAVADPSGAAPSPAYADDITGGGGRDTVDYRSRAAGTAVASRNNKADDGRTGEFDNVRTDVEVVLGASVGSAPMPTVTIAPVPVTESSGRPAALTVTLSTVSSRDTTVTWTTANGTARAGRDFVAASGTVVIPAGTLTATVTVQIVADTVTEATENFFVKFSGPVNATLPSPNVTVTVDD